MTWICRRHLKPLLSAPLLVPLVAGAAVPSASATSSISEVLYSQNDNYAHAHIVANHFIGRLHLYSSRGADDFTVPTGTWTISQVDVTGVYSGDQRATSVSVVVYADGGGQPGDQLANVDVAGTIHRGSFSVALGDQAIALGSGTYWISVQPEMKGSFWSWKTTSVPHGSPAVWRNAPNGFGTGCRSFTPLQTCESSEGPDFMFALEGTSD